MEKKSEILKPLRKSESKQSYENLNECYKTSDDLVSFFNLSNSLIIQKEKNIKEDDIFEKPKNKLIKNFKISTFGKSNDIEQEYEVIWFYYSGWKKEELLTLDQVFHICKKENIPINNNFKSLQKNENNRFIKKITFGNKYFIN